ncbi:hypothetical protein KIF24_20285 [Micromonospora sp. Llam7]|uniref:hypothetical protein n=1 Tax=Micromonospora tarapacensis TaxID=2835305 RepID=UPI001C82EBEF|nr:hypothetical protein [Micromonospora tarapacensis]MBX7268143.1 hypothetical protein [Micromonospora tarapacensis]
MELLAVIMLATPVSLILFSSELLWRDDLAVGALLLAILTVPPGFALWLIERRRGRQGERRAE